jgi:hypothetical protein
MQTPQQDGFHIIYDNAEDAYEEEEALDELNAKEGGGLTEDLSRLDEDLQDAISAELQQPMASQAILQVCNAYVIDGPG